MQHIIQNDVKHLNEISLTDHFSFQVYAYLGDVEQFVCVRLVDYLTKIDKFFTFSFFRNLVVTHWQLL